MFILFITTAPLYAELFEGVMSFKVKIYHEYNGERIFYYTEDCTGDLNTTTVRYYFNCINNSLSMNSVGL